MIEEAVRIEQMNEAIALFDGWDKINGKYASLYKKDGKVYVLGDFKYHSSWEWLMPVWYKFRDLNVGINERVGHGLRVRMIINLMGFQTIDRTHKALFESIQWYQKQQANE
jgi:hypothetical protein